MSSATMVNQRGRLRRALGLGSALVLAACNPAASTAPSVAAPSTAPASDTGASPSGVAASQAADVTGKIVVWDFNQGTATGASYPQVDKNFIAMHPGVTIDHVAQPAGTYGQVVQTAMTTKAGPDVFMLQTPNAISKYSAELVPLDSLITPDFKSQLDGWTGMTPNLDPTGTVYGVPYSFGGTAWYWNKQLFTKAGLDPSTFPTTYTDFDAALAQLKAAGVTPIGGGDKAGVFATWWTFIALPGVMDAKTCFGLGDGTTKFSDPRVKTVMQDWIDLIKNGNFDANQAELNAGDFSGFGNWINGKAAIVWAFPGYRPILAADDKTNLGTAAADLAIDGPTAHFYMAGATLGWSIPTWSKNQAAAWAYIQYMTGKEAQQLHLDVDKVGPTNLAVDVSKADPDLAATFNLWKANPGSEHCGRIIQGDTYAELGRQMTLVEAGSVTLDAALAAVDAFQLKTYGN
jgi:raffinose/stachyose/melibiose transport system substrate-binding protein